MLSRPPTRSMLPLSTLRMYEHSPLPRDHTPISIGKSLLKVHPHREMRHVQDRPSYFQPVSRALRTRRKRCSSPERYAIRVLAMLTTRQSKTVKNSKVPQFLNSPTVWKTLAFHFRKQLTTVACSEPRFRDFAFTLSLFRRLLSWCRW